MFPAHLRKSFFSAEGFDYGKNNRKNDLERRKTMIYKEGHSSYGHCWIEGNGVFFWVYVMDGRSKYGPYSSLADAEREYARWC